MKEKVMTFLRDEGGLTTVEYALAGALVSAALVTAFLSLGDQVAAMIASITAEID